MLPLFGKVPCPGLIFGLCVNDQINVRPRGTYSIQAKIYVSSHLLNAEAELRLLVAYYKQPTTVSPSFHHAGPIPRSL